MLKSSLARHACLDVKGVLLTKLLEDAEMVFLRVFRNSNDFL